MTNLLPKPVFILFILSFLMTTAAEKGSSQSAVNSITFGADGVVYLDDFEKYETGGMPDEWYNRDGDKIPAHYDEPLLSEYHYEILEENGNRFLRFDGKGAKHLNFPLADKANLNIHETPILKWRWRIHEVPVGGNEDEDGKNDAAASVYVVFDMGRVLFRRVPKSIRYTWSSTLPKGTELSKFFGNQKIIVMGTGGEKRGKWQTFERNIVEDYKRLFGDSPPESPLALLVLSAGNSTNTLAKADYDDFELHPLP